MKVKNFAPSGFCILQMSCVHNFFQYEDSVVQMVGEGYEDDVTLDNIHSVAASTDAECEEGNMADDDVTGMCHVYCIILM